MIRCAVSRTARAAVIWIPHVTLLFLLAAIPAFAQTSSSEARWSGQAQCQTTVQSDGYSHQETQTWKLTGGAPTLQGAIQLYPASWSVAGQGTVQRTGAQVLSAVWNTKVPPTNASIAIFVRASDNRLIIKTFQAQLTAPAAVTGTRQVSVAGAAPTQSTVQYAAWEWPFPMIEDSPTSTSVSGSGNVVIAGSLLPMQSPTINGTATCTWQFSKGASGSPQPVLASNTAAISSGSSQFTSVTACENLVISQGGPTTPTALGSIPAGTSRSVSASLTSATNRNFYQITLPAGVDANISLSGLQAGSDFDLYAYHSDLTPIGCSLTRGTASENIKTAFGATQSSNTVIIEVSSYMWSATSSSYTLSINGLAASGATIR